MKQYKYLAFISYTHKDEKIAQWLQNKLETYKLPSVLYKRYSDREFPKKLRPIFRDKTNLSKSGNIDDLINPELDKSKYLIVICSLQSKNSIGVQKEIERFIEQEKVKYIIPFIIEDIADTSDSRIMHYPKGIDSETLGISIQQLGKNQATTKVISEILNVDYDLLWDRHKERQVKNVIGIAAIIIFAALSFAIFALIQSNKIAEQRDKALINESLVLSDYAKQNSKTNAIKAIKYSLDALPQKMDDPDRPYIPEAEAILRQLDFQLEYDSACILSTYQGNFNKYVLNFTPDEEQIITSIDKEFSVLDISKGEIETFIQYISDHNYNNKSKISPDGKKVISTDSIGLKVWDINSKEEIVLSVDPIYKKGQLHEARFSESGRILLFRDKDYCNVWDLLLNKEIMKVKAYMYNIYISPNDKYTLIKRDDKFAYIIDNFTNKIAAKIEMERGKWIGGIAFSPDSKSLAYQTSNYGDNYSMRVLNIEKNIERAKIEFTSKSFKYSLKFSPDGERIVGTMQNDKLGVWKIGSDCKTSS